MGGDLRPAILALNSVLIVASAAAISCRVGRRLFLVGSFSWHDALITVAAVSATIFSVLQMVSTRYGLGLPTTSVGAADMKTILKLGMASRMFYFTCNWAVKHSLLLFYTTLTVDRWPRISIYTMHVVAFAFGMTCMFATIFQCTPINKIWRGPSDPSVPGTCLNINEFNYFNSSFMLANDCILYAMPLIFTWRLHVSRPQRIAVGLLFALGGLVLAASGARVYFVDVQARRPDFTHRFAMTMMCAVIENHLAIIVACAPSIKVILLHMFPSLQHKFEKFVSKHSPENSGFSIGTIAIDAECGMVQLGKPLSAVRPLSERTTTDSSAKSRRETRKWWMPPSSWEVNREGREGCPLAEIPSWLR